LNNSVYDNNKKVSLNFGYQKAVFISDPYLTLEDDSFSLYNTDMSFTYGPNERFAFMTSVGMRDRLFTQRSSFNTIKLIRSHILFADVNLFFTPLKYQYWSTTLQLGSSYHFRNKISENETYKAGIGVLAGADLIIKLNPSIEVHGNTVMEKIAQKSDLTDQQEQIYKTSVGFNISF
ncbi:MAG: hypothetical protein HQK51_09205, partial [Oligoflexia bacterium]|nr:hypothetical protein [Oligoflexia bacterium]